MIICYLGHCYWPLSRELINQIHIQIIHILTKKDKAEYNMLKAIREIDYHEVLFNKEGEIKRHKMICLREQRGKIHQQILILCSHYLRLTDTSHRAS